VHRYPATVEPSPNPSLTEVLRSRLDALTILRAVVGYSALVVFFWVMLAADHDPEWWIILPWLGAIFITPSFGVASWLWDRWLARRS